MERSCADLVLILRPNIRHHPLVDILIEFKYVSLQELKMTKDDFATLDENAIKDLLPVQKKLSDARKTLNRYATVLNKKYGDALRLCQYSVVSLGFERLICEKTTNSQPTHL